MYQLINNALSGAITHLKKSVCENGYVINKLKMCALCNLISLLCNINKYNNLIFECTQ